MSFRPINDTRTAQHFLEGAGVSLFRAFGFKDPEECDPFLMLDDFRNDDPEKFKAGFPWHPHRGIETITYVLEGSVEHQDSLGNKGILSGGGLLSPRQENLALHLFLWVHPGQWISSV